MKELLTVVTRKGQITVPSEIRRAWDLKEGDHVAVSLAENRTDEARLRPVRSVADMTFGSVRPRRRPEDLKALRREYQDSVAAEVVQEGRSTSRTGPATSNNGATARKRARAGRRPKQSR